MSRPEDTEKNDHNEDNTESTDTEAIGVENFKDVMFEAEGEKGEHSCSSRNDEKGSEDHMDRMIMAEAERQIPLLIGIQNSIMERIGVMLGFSIVILIQLVAMLGIDNEHIFMTIIEAVGITVLVASIAGSLYLLSRRIYTSPETGLPYKFTVDTRDTPETLRADIDWGVKRCFVLLDFQIYDLTRYSLWITLSSIIGATLFITSAIIDVFI